MYYWQHENCMGVRSVEPPPGVVLTPDVDFDNDSPFAGGIGTW